MPIPRAVVPASGLTGALQTLAENRRTIVVDTEGAAVALLPNAVQGAVTWQLNEPVAADFSMQADDPDCAYLFAEKFREVQIWMGDQLLAWGPVVLIGIDGPAITFQVRGASWYLGKRYVGMPERLNALVNPGFETGLDGWTALRTRYFYNLRLARRRQVYVNRVGDGVSIEQDLTPYTLATQSGASYGTRTVVPGDTLWALAAEYYGSGLLWDRIYDANQAQIEADARAAGLWDPRDPGHWIFPGQTFTIPDVQEEDTSSPVTSNTEWGSVWLFQEFTVYGGIRGATVTMSAWCMVRSDEFTGYGLHKEGMYVARLPPDYRTNNFFTQNGLNNTLEYRGLYSEPCEGAVSTIDELHPFDQWVRHEVSVTVPPGTTEVVHCRLSGVQGRTSWRLPRVTSDTAEEWFDEDQRDIVNDLVVHAQNPTFGKTDVNLQVAEGGHGVDRTTVAFHHDHENILGLIRGFATLDDGFDIREVFGPTTRTLVLDHPRSGDYRGHKRLSSSIGGAPGTVVDWAYTFQGDAAANSIGKMSSTSGAGREERAALDEAAFDNGLVLEAVTPVRAGTDIDRLQGIANEELAVSVQPEDYTVLTQHERVVRYLGGDLQVGDWVPIDLARGAFVVNTVARVNVMTLLPSNAWELVLTPSQVPPYELVAFY